MESKKGGQVSYPSVLVQPEKLATLNSKLAMRIIIELSKKPGCAMDVARGIKQHEQKVYYHIKRLEKAGILKRAGTEKRYGMIANMYVPVSPVIAAKLYEGGSSVVAGARPSDPNMARFFHPFIEAGKLNARIIVGDPYPHGRYDKPAKSPVHMFDLAMLIGRLTEAQTLTAYKLDVNVRESDLKENLILIGSSKENAVVEKINEHMPIYFDQSNEWAVVSKTTKRAYDDPRTGVIVKCDNPFAPGKKILLLAGVATRGMQSVSIAITQHMEHLMEGVQNPDSMFRVVEGFDSEGNNIIDSVKFLE